MEHTAAVNPGLVIALALALGMVAQALAHHLRIPGIVLLLAAGVALGPDGAGVILPESLGPALSILTGFAVAVILFEGGMNLKFRQLRRAQRSIRQLLIAGSLITIAGGAIAAHFILQWPWETSVLFGTLVMVTGPTVVNPLLKRLNVKRTVATVLEAEGVLIDSIGAVVAIVALEAVLSPGHGNLLLWVWHIVSRLGFGLLAGAAVAIVLILLYRVRRLIPEGTENVFTLAVVLALFQCSNMILPESGIAAVTAAGIVVGNFNTRALRDLVEFKEELTVLLIGMLFILLAADVRLSQIADLGLPALIVVALLMFVVRPLAVIAGTWSSKLDWKERFFIAWIGPRGIVAAAVASFFAVTLSDQGLAGGYELRALVFLVIAITVVFAGLTGGTVAGFLGLRRPSRQGWVVLGASPLARGLVKLLKEDGQDVVSIDSNADHCQAAEQDCTRVIYGNGLQERYLQRAEIDTRRGALALTANDEVNFLFIQKVKDEARGIELFAALKSTATSLTEKMLHHADAALLFGATVDAELWDRRFNARQVHLQLWRLAADPPPAEPVDQQNGTSDKPQPVRYAGSGMLSAALRRNGKLSPIGDKVRFRKNDEVYFFITDQELAPSAEQLTQSGWLQLESIDKEAFSTSVCHLE